MSIIKWLKNLFSGSRDESLNEAIAAFQSASEAFDRAYDRCEPYGGLALSRASGQPDAGEYTVGELDAHFNAMVGLTEQFSPLLDSASRLREPPDLRTSTEELLNVYCEMYKLAADRFASAASSAMLSALQGSLETAKMDSEVFTLRLGLERARPSSEEVAEVKGMKRSVHDMSEHFEALEARAKAAEEQAKIFRETAQRAAHLIE